MNKITSIEDINALILQVLKNVQHLSTKVTLILAMINGRAKWLKILVQWPMLMVEP